MMNIFLLVGWVAVIVIAYVIALYYLKKLNLL